jgi:hypothetical protein
MEEAAVMMTGLSWKRIKEALEILNCYPGSKERLFPHCGQLQRFCDF